MDTRVAIIGIIVENPESVAPLNAILHQYGDCIFGRMGIPYRQRGVQVISIAVDAPTERISALSGRIGMLSGVSAKAVYAKLPDPCAVENM